MTNLQGLSWHVNDSYKWISIWNQFPGLRIQVHQLTCANTFLSAWNIIFMHQKGYWCLFNEVIFFVWRPCQYNWVVKSVSECMLQTHFTLPRKKLPAVKKSNREQVTEGIFPWAFTPRSHKPSCLRKLRWSRHTKKHPAKKNRLILRLPCAFSFDSGGWSNDFIQFNSRITIFYRVFKLDPKCHGEFLFLTGIVWSLSV